MRNKVLKPEKIVERDVLIWAASKRWFLHVIDSGKKRDSNKEMVNTRAAPYGISDLVGCDSFGTAVFIELKAPGKESACRLSQRIFLERAIENNAFACVVSSDQTLRDIYAEWIVMGSAQGQVYLKSKLPKSTEVGGRRMRVS